MRPSLALALLVGTTAVAVADAAAARAAGSLSATGTPAVGAICDASRPSQRWSWLNESLLIAHDAKGAVLCLGVVGGIVVGQPCLSDPGAGPHGQTRWRFNATSSELAIVDGRGWTRPPLPKAVLDLSGYGYYGPNSIVDIYKATGAANQKWRLDPATGLLHSLQTVDKNDSLCVDLVEVPELVNPCLDKTQPFAAMTFCNASLPLHVRVADAVCV